MFKKKECIAMILAGGQGSRLYALTSRLAKPAVSFGGKYRIIDFTLSNCVNSGIDTVGVLTQYQPLLLNDYIGNGLPWDLDRTFGGVKILPPYQGRGSADWYSGTANAIWQNRDFIARYSPDYLLVLSGDHIYRMNYAKMLAYHRRSGADCTIAVIDVPLEEASRFGIMTTDGDGRIVKFSEKPKVPESTLASMGIYIFNTRMLLDSLAADERDPTSSNDFGKNIIPSMLSQGKKLFAYRFDGYWKDVGTVRSLWEANMDMLGEDPPLRLNDDSWRIYSRHEAAAPQYIGKTASVSNSSVTEGCEIFGEVINSVLGSGVTVEAGASVRDSVIMSRAVIRAGATVDRAIVDDGAVIGARAVVGRRNAPDCDIAVIGAGVKVVDDEAVEPGAMMYPD